MRTADSLNTLLLGGGPVTDWGRLESAVVQSKGRPTSEAELIEIIQYGRQHGLKLSLRGAGHGAGGQSFCQNGVQVDMRGMQRVLELDRAARTVRVQAGASWAVLTRALEPCGLAVTTKQEFDIFTIGGSIAANVHGKSIDYGPLIESIRSFRLLKADGTIVPVSRTENAELFPLVVGGYGLFGIVVDVTFELVEDQPVEKSEVVLMKRDALFASYGERIRQAGAGPALCYGFLDQDCERGFYVTYRYLRHARKYSLAEFKRDEPSPALFNLLTCLQRSSGFVRRKSFGLLWAASSKPELTLRSRRLLLWNRPPNAFQNMLLQKYFIPIDQFAEFTRRVGEIFRSHGDALPLFTLHFRYVPANDEALLSFAPQECICLIPCYLARKESRAWKDKLAQVTSELLAAALDLGGRHYLAFDILAAPEQVRKAYPQWERFCALKRRHDPQGLWNSLLYEKYAVATE